MSSPRPEPQRRRSSVPSCCALRPDGDCGPVSCTARERQPRAQINRRVRRSARRRVDRHSTTPPRDRPRPQARWGSDVIADVLRDLDIPYIALVPGSSYRGPARQHRQLSRQPRAADDPRAARGDRGRDRARLCEGDRPDDGRGAARERRAACARRWRSTTRGATARRSSSSARPGRGTRRSAGSGSTGSTRARDQGGLIRNFTKWDNQPGSPAAAAEALLRAAQIAQTAPRGPVYVNLDVALQEAEDRARCRRCRDVRVRSAAAPVQPSRRVGRRGARSCCDASAAGDARRAAARAASTAGTRASRSPKS